MIASMLTRIERFCLIGGGLSEVKWSGVEWAIERIMGRLFVGSEGKGYEMN